MQLSTFNAWASAMNTSMQLTPTSPLQSETGELLDVIGSAAIQIDGMSTSITVTVARMLNIKYEHQMHIICRTKLSRLDDAR